MPFEVIPFPSALMWAKTRINVSPDDICQRPRRKSFGNELAAANSPTPTTVLPKRAHQVPSNELAHGAGCKQRD
eukprot:3547589-Pleurochrysis_carterae.AAC.1